MWRDFDEATDVEDGAWLRVGDLEPEAFARCAHRLARAKRIDLSEVEVGPAGLTALFDAAPARLGWLLLGDDDCDGAVLDVVAERAPESLTSLTLRGYLAATLGDADIARFTTSAAYARLTELSLFDVNLGAGAARAIAEADNRLRSLSFAGGHYSKNAIGADGARALDSAKLAGLTTLALGHNALGDAGVEALGRARHLRRIEVLGLSANDFGHDGFKHLAVSDVLDSVKALHLDLNPLDASAMGALARVPLPALETLTLYGAPLGDDGLQALATSPAMERLARLNVVSTGLTDPSAEVLLAMRARNAALRIDARRNRFGEAASERLAGADIRA